MQLKNLYYFIKSRDSKGLIILRTNSITRTVTRFLSNAYIIKKIKNPNKWLNICKECWPYEGLYWDNVCVIDDNGERIRNHVWKGAKNER